ncbi:DUF5683 domain-containing protein [Candidatus Chrysopegis kryptomonas]|uniref:DUF5683 domain-containing protein n=1 Tax=Candidatus Chryseopegocella kryptomonas TaxID=1633643 RepID=A0A0P1MM27_9BACT|nr:DUF5683 domain-containing protein [Candidatus Chrysopegis kryptomonas]CUS96476.1 hypothetical protein JGI23_00135 [Candidatus Chrysopegis kryptomonas]
MKAKILILIFVIKLTAFSQADTLKSVKSQKSKSPTKAMVLSALLPGLGQFYNESYWKIPVIYGLAGYFIYEFKQNDKNYRYYRDLFVQSLQISGGDYRYKRLRDFYRDQRDLFGIYLFVLYLANIADAYVDAHLYNFDVGENLSVKLLPMEIKFEIKF